ncbi:MAG: fibronectin type III domain-containing protein, partial [Terriglobia bacterium]
ATTQAASDTTSPSVPTNLAATAASSTQINLSWTASTDNVAVTGYKIYRNGTQVGTSAVASYQDTGLTGSTTYNYTVSAYDAANNNSAQSSTASATTQAAADTTPPSVPANLTASATSATQVNLSWSASTDNVAVTGYRIYRNGSPVGTSATPSYQDSGLTASTTYSYTVSAYDAANNSSAPSSAATATTWATADTTPPLISSESITSVGATTATMNWMTNEPADSQLEYGTTMAYSDMTPLSPSLVTGHSVGMSGLKADTLYHCRVRSRDAAGNLAFSEDYTFTTTTETPTNQTCPQGFGKCFEAMVPAGGGLSQVSSGQGDLSVLYGVMNSSGTSWPVALANFGFTQDGVLVTEVGVPASAPFTSTRLFVDYAGPSADSGVAMVNPNDTPIVVNADLRNPRGEFVSSSSISLEAKGHTAQFVSQLITNMPNPFLGTLTLSSASPFAAVNLRLASNGHGETLFSVLPLADQNRSSGVTRLIFPQVVDGGGLPTQILLMNSSVNTTSTGFISFLDDDGNALALDFGPGVGVQSSLSYSLAPNGMVKFSTTGLGALRVGYAVVTPLSGFVPVGSGMFSINGDAGLASQAGVPNAMETMASRLFVERATDPLPRDTGVAIVNRNAVEAQVTLTLVGVDGSTQAGRLTVPANGHVARFVSELFPGLPAQYQGVLTMTSPVPLAAMTLRQTFNQRSEPIYSTLPVADLTHPPQGPLYIPQFADGGGYQTQLILINTSNSSSLIQIEFFNDQGANINMLLK